MSLFQQRFGQPDIRAPISNNISHVNTDVFTFPYYTLKQTMLKMIPGVRFKCAYIEGILQKRALSSKRKQGG